MSVSEAPPALEVEGVSSWRGGLEVLHRVSLWISHELVAVFGLNGSGKSTLLRTISGLTRPSEGSIRAEGREIAGIPAHETAKLGIAFMAQSNQVFGSLTVTENLELAGYLLGPSALRRAIERELTRSPRLGQRARVRASSLSGGERQMLALAKALMLDPKLLLLDEPSAGLAPVAIDDIYDVLRALHHEGLPILMVEQNVARALEIADRAIVLYLGNCLGSVDLHLDANASSLIRELMLGHVGTAEDRRNGPRAD